MYSQFHLYKYIFICFSDRHGSSALLTGEALDLFQNVTCFGTEGVVVIYLVLPVTLSWNRQIKC